jgi:hypothetical protein
LPGDTRLDPRRRQSLVRPRFGPTAGEEAPGTPGYEIEALNPDDAWLWLTRFRDALGEPEGLVLATGLLKTVDRIQSSAHPANLTVVPPRSVPSHEIGVYSGDDGFER